MQKEHAGSGKFVTLISYAQISDAEAIDYLKSKAPAIPAYDQLDPANAPCGQGIPDTYLFDHEGKLVQHGHPLELLPLVADLVAKVPEPVPANVLGALRPVHCSAEAAALLDVARPALEPLRKLELLAAGTDDVAAEARAIVEQVRRWLPLEAERLNKVAKRAPGRTAFQAEQYLTRFKGVDAALEARVKALVKSLHEQAGVKDFAAALKDLERAAAAKDAKEGALFRQRGQSALYRLAKNAKLPSALRKELAELGLAGG